jgi:hypothetical protein
MKPKIFLYVGSKCSHIHPAVGMRCLFGPTQYRYLIPPTVLTSIYISDCNTNRASDIILSILNIMLLPLKMHGFFGELPLKFRGLRGLLYSSFCRDLSGLVDGDASRLLRKAGATPIAK